MKRPNSPEPDAYPTYADWQTNLTELTAAQRLLAWLKHHGRLKGLSRAELTAVRRELADICNREGQL